MAIDIVTLVMGIAVAIALLMQYQSTPKIMKSKRYRVLMFIGIVFALLFLIDGLGLIDFMDFSEIWS